MKSISTILILVLVQFSAGSASAALLKVVSKFDLPGPAGKRFDYLTIDYKHGYLLSAHLGAGLLYVINLKTNQVVSTIPGVPGVEGVEFVSELDKVYTSDWKDQTIGVIDLHKMRLIKKIPAIAKPDGSAYASDFHKIYVSDEVGKSVIIVDVIHDEIVTTLHFDSETGMPQYDPVARKIYVNLQDQNLFAVIDPATDKVVATYPVGKCQGNHGMALDDQNRRAFLACEGNDLLTVFDLNTNAPMAYFPVAPGVDVLKFDAGLGRVYAACYSGAISVIHERDPNHFSKLGDVRVQPKVHSLAVDKRTHRVYTPEQQENGQPVAKMVVYEPVPPWK